MKTRLATLISLLALGALGQAGAQPQVRYATSPDDKRIAFDVTGPANAPAIMLLHGGGQNRQVWHRLGYVDSLARTHRVITLDMRAHGESDKPVEQSDYAIDRLVSDFLAVADAAGVRDFSLWGFSYGANVGRYLAVRSDRVRSMVYIGVAFGPAADTMFARIIRETHDKWAPIAAAARAGTLDTMTLSETDRTRWRQQNVPAVLAWSGALVHYPPVEPRDMRSPTLWVVGTRNAAAYASARSYESSLAGTRVRLQLLEGLNHPQELDSLPRLLPPALAFTRGSR